MQNLVAEVGGGALQLDDGLLHHLLLKHVYFLLLNALLTTRDQETPAALRPTTTYTHTYASEGECVCACLCVWEHVHMFVTSNLHHLHHVSHILIHQNQVALWDIDAFISDRCGDEHLTLIGALKRVQNPFLIVQSHSCSTQTHITSDWKLIRNADWKNQLVAKTTFHFHSVYNLKSYNN